MVTRNKGGQNVKGSVKNDAEKVLVLDDSPDEDNVSNIAGGADREEEDVLDGMDLDGVPEQEKEEIKRAILASRQDQYASGVQLNKGSSHSGQDVGKKEIAKSTTPGISQDLDQCETEQMQGADDRSSVQNRPETKTKSETMAQAGGDDDDDETQPPSDQEPGETDSLDLSVNTLDVTSDGVYHRDTDLDEDVAKSQSSQTTENDRFETQQPSMEEEEGEEPLPDPVADPVDAEEGSLGFSPTQGPSHSTESHGPQASEKIKCTKDASAKASGPVDTVTTELAKSASQEINTRKDLPLQRHYRAVTKPIPTDDRYFAIEGISHEQCAKAIYQLFETYRRKLKEAQRKLKERLDWGAPVKSGQHQSRTIDVKRRGYPSMYVELSDDEDSQEGEKQTKSVNVKGSSKSDDDFEMKKKVPSKQPNRETNEELMGADTQPYEHIEKSKNVDTNAAGIGTKPSRLRRRNSKVLAEDTQDPDVQKQNVSDGGSVQYVIDETQPQETDMEWLSVKKDNHGQRFENPMQKAKLKGFVTPKLKKVTETLSEKTNNDEKENLKQHNEPVDLAKETETKPAATRGKKRKNRKEPVTLVEDTQDVNDEVQVNFNVRSKVQKRKCFKLSSDSEDESIPETQGLDDSPEVTIVEVESPPEKTESAKKHVKTVADMLNNLKNIYVKEEHKVPCGDSESQSPVIKRSRKLQKKSEQALDNKAQARGQMKDPMEQTVRQDGRQARDTGVKRLFSRPESKESNASDDVSVTSSQISNTYIDESGDLYSTQIFDTAHNTKGNQKDVNQNVKAKNEKGAVSNKIDEILSIDSDEEVYIVGEVKKNYKNIKPKPSSTTKDFGSRTRGGTVSKEPSISKYFSNIDKSKTSPIDQDSDGDRSKHLIDTSYKGGNISFGLEEDYLKYVTTEEEPTRKSFMRVEDLPVNEASIGRVPFVCQPGQSNDIRNKKTLNSDSEKPISLTDSFNTLRVQPKAKRPRKVSETITLEEEETVEGVAIAGHGEEGNGRGGKRRRVRQTKTTETIEPPAKVIKQDEPTMPCPLCNVNFPMTVIQEHASACDGTIPIQDNVENQPPDNRSRVVGADRGQHRQHSDSDEDILIEQEITIPVNINDPDVQDVMRNMKNSQGVTGECEQCCICDQYIVKGREMEQHLQQCMLRAKQQQLEVDTKGYQQAYNPQLEEEVEARHTRGRSRQTRDGSPTVTRTVRGVGRGGRTAKPVSEDDGYTPGLAVNGNTSESSGETDSSSWDDSSDSSEVDDNLTLGALARAGSSSLVTGPWNSQPVQTQSDGSHAIPDWLKKSANSPIKSFVPLSMQNSEYFNKQFSYNEKRVSARQDKRKREQSKTKRRTKRRKVRRKKKTSRKTVNG